MSERKYKEQGILERSDEIASREICTTENCRDLEHPGTDAKFQTYTDMAVAEMNKNRTSRKDSSVWKIGIMAKHVTQQLASMDRNTKQITRLSTHHLNTFGCTNNP